MSDELSQLRAENARLTAQLHDEILRRAALWNRLYSTREIWCDVLDDKAMTLAQSEADTHGVPVTVNVLGIRKHTARPKELTALRSENGQLQSRVTELEGLLREARELYEIGFASGWTQVQSSQLLHEKHGRAIQAKIDAALNQSKITKE